MSSSISGSTASGSVATLSTNADSSSASELLRLNSGDSTNGDSGNILMRTYVSSLGTEWSVMVGTGSRDSP